MINLDIYTKAQKQNFRTILIQCSRIGITDVNEILEALNAEVQKDIDSVKVKPSKKDNRVKIIPCPSCKTGRLSKVVNPDGLQIYGCRKCKYSEIR